VSRRASGFFELSGSVEKPNVVLFHSTLIFSLNERDIPRICRHADGSLIVGGTEKAAA